MADEKRDDPLDHFIAIIFVTIVALVVASIYYIDVWYSVRLTTLEAFSALPGPIQSTILFYYPDLVNAIPLMKEDMIFHANDFYTYYKEDDVGISKKSQIDMAALYIFMPWATLFIGIMVYLELSKVRGKINKPGKKNAMYNYARTQMEIWPFIKVVAPIMEKIAREDDLDKGPYAAPQVPLLWMEKEGLLIKVKTKNKRDLLTVSQREQFTLDRAKAYKSLVNNLGRPWTCVDDLTFTEKCLFSVLVPHVYGKVKESRLNNRRILSYMGAKLTEKNKKKLDKMESDLKAHISSVVDKYKERFAMPYFNIHEFDEPYDPIIASFQKVDTEKDMRDKGDKLIAETLLTHRYVKSVFFSIMIKSWTYGVLAPSELLWLKSIDRDLYYVVTQQGRNSAFVEVAGAWSHYISENAYGFKMLAPQVFPAIRALDLDLFKTHDNYIPHEDYDDSAKWDKLVPDGINSGQGFTPSKMGNTTSKIY